MRIYWFVLGTLTVWRISHLLNAEDGPDDIFVRLRRFVGDGLIGSLLDCFYCLSIWIALPIALWFGETAVEKALLCPALSAAAILLERITTRLANASLQMPSCQDSHLRLEETYELLRSEEATDEFDVSSGTRSLDRADTKFTITSHRHV